MPEIQVETIIRASRETCFDLARDMRMHEKTTGATQEKVVRIVRSGSELDLAPAAILLELGDVVTFEAKHLGVRQLLVSKIVAFERPSRFVDVMQRGAFRSLVHEHRFEDHGDFTTMIDVLKFESPLGPLGSIANALFLTRYMRRFLSNRGRELKQVAEARALGSA